MSFLTFTLLYTPCAAAVGTVRQELGRRRDAAAFVTIQCLIAWFAALVVYQISRLL